MTWSSAWLLLVPILPGILWLWIFRRADHVEPEPHRWIFLTYFLGVLGIIPAAVLERMLVAACGNPTERDPFALALTCFVAIGLSEELFKYLAVRWFIYRHREFNEPLDGIIYAASAALGFASLENLVYVADFSSGLHLRWEILGARSLLSLPGHVLFAATWGYALGRMRFGGRRRAWPALLAAAGLHGLFDYILLVPALRPFMGLYLCLLVPLVVQQIRVLRRESPFLDDASSRRRAR